MNRKRIDPATVMAGKFLLLRREAQLLYFYLAVQADENSLVDVYVVSNMIGLSFVEIRILAESGFIEFVSADSTTVRVIGLCD